MIEDDDDFADEVERRLTNALIEAGEDPWEDSDRAVYLRQDIVLELQRELAARTNIDVMKDAIDEQENR